MCINSIFPKFAFGVRCPQKLKKSSTVLSKKEYETLANLKKLYEKMEKLYKSDEYKKTIAQRDESLSSFNKYVLEKESNISDTHIPI